MKYCCAVLVSRVAQDIVTAATTPVKNKLEEKTV